jgi:hypothetical protein|tara:strand:- start:445 stop:1011 length:567 start_codon:yes stop_codon:yes gene_type:complete
MKTPQTSHGVLDPITGIEITTPLGLPREPRHTNPYRDKSLTEGAQNHDFLRTLGMFNGSELPPIRHFCVTPSLGILLLSEGAHYFRECGGGNGAYWLFDIFVTEVLPLFRNLKDESMLVLNIEVKDHQAKLTAKGESMEALYRSHKKLKRDPPDGVVWTRDIDFTDLCDMDFNLWMMSDGHVLIPSEY